MKAEDNVRITEGNSPQDTLHPLAKLLSAVTEEVAGDTLELASEVEDLRVAVNGVIEVLQGMTPLEIMELVAPMKEMIRHTVNIQKSTAELTKKALEDQGMVELLVHKPQRH